MPFFVHKRWLVHQRQKAKQETSNFFGIPQSLIAEGCRNKFYASNHLGGAWSLPGQPYLCKEKSLW